MLLSRGLFPESLEIDAIVARTKESIALRNSLLVPEEAGRCFPG